MMKAIVFTLDAVFALIIAGSGIAMLVYFVYVPNTAFVLGASSLNYWWATMSSSKLSTLTSPALAPMMVQQSSASMQYWPFKLQSQGNNAGNPYGPSTLTLEYVYNATSPINPGTIVSDRGIVYFTAGNAIIAINGSTESTLWTAYSPVNSTTGTSPYPNATMTYGPYLIYATSAGLVALWEFNGDTAWSTNALWNQVVSTEPSATDRNMLLSASNGRILVGTNDSASQSGYGLYAIYPTNGTVVGVSSSARAFISSIATAGNGQLVAAQPGSPSGSPSIDLYTGIYNTTSAAARIWSVALPASDTPTDVATYGNMIAYGAGDSANIISLSGQPIASTALGSRATGLSIYGGRIYAQSSNSITVMNPSGSVLWTENMGQRYGQAQPNDTPVESSQYVYTMWGGRNITVQDASNGALVASAEIPYSGNANPYMALANGRLIVSKGTHLMVFGSCWLISSNYSIAYSIYYLFLTGQGSCSRVLLSTANMPLNYSPMTFATLFPGNGLLNVTPSNRQWSSCNFTLLAWSYDLGMPGAMGGVADYRSSSTSNSLSIESNNTAIRFTAAGQSASNSLYAAGNYLDKWTFTALTVTQGYVTAYVDGSPLPVSSPANIGCLGLNEGTIGSQDTYFTGNIVNVQLYNYTMSPPQISARSQHYLELPPTSTYGLLQWLPLEGGYNNYAAPYTPGFPYGPLHVEQVSYQSPYGKNLYTSYSQYFPIIEPLYNNYT